MQIVSNRDNLHEMPNSVFLKNKKRIIAICCLLFNCPSIFSRQHFEIFFSYFSQTQDLTSICMKCQILFSGLFEPKVISCFVIAAHTCDGTCFLLR